VKYRLVYTRRAEKDIETLDINTKDRIGKTQTAQQMNQRLTPHALPPVSGAPIECFASKSLSKATFRLSTLRCFSLHLVP